MSPARQWFTARRKQIILALVLVLAFVGALVLWAGRGDDGATALPKLPSTSATPVTPSGSATPSTGVSGSPSASVSGLPGLPGLPGLGLPDTTELTTLGPGNHRVVLTARSDKPLLAVSYSVKGDSRGKVIYNVKSPVTIARTVSGARPYAIIALQVGPTGTTGSCSVSIDGKVVDSKHYNAAYAVIQCLG